LKPSFDLTARPEDCAYKVSTVDAALTIAEFAASYRRNRSGRAAKELN
jgi:hypothetical protein